MPSPSIRLAMLLTWCAVAAPLAAAEGWSLPNLNPFSKKDAATARPKPSEKENWFKAPSLPKLPSWNSPKKADRMPAASQGPSTFDKMSSGTKEFFSKTKSTLMPWTDDDKTSRKSGSYRSASRTQRKSLLSSGGDEGEREPEDIRTVNDFLSLPRVD